jgi:hypothetical protein
MVGGRVQRYLDGLPRGLDSHPAFLQKASVFRQFLELGSGVNLGALPAPLADLARDPPPVTDWVSEVHATATYLGLADLQGWDDDALVARALQLNQRLLSSPLYRVLMLVVSAPMLIRGAADRWATMHKGIRLAVTLETPTSAKGAIEYAPRLLPSVVARCYVTGIQAAFDVARVQRPVVTFETWSDVRTTFRCTWS